MGLASKSSSLLGWMLSQWEPLLLCGAVYEGLHRLGYNSVKPEQFDSVESLLKQLFSTETVQLGRAAPRENSHCKRYLGLLLGIVPLQRTQIELIGSAILSLSWQATPSSCPQYVYTIDPQEDLWRYLLSAKGRPLLRGDIPSKSFHLVLWCRTVSASSVQRLQRVEGYMHFLLRPQLWLHVHIHWPRTHFRGSAVALFVEKLVPALENATCMHPVPTWPCSAWYDECHLM